MYYRIYCILDGLKWIKYFVHFTMFSWSVFDLRSPLCICPDGGWPAQRIANLFVPTVDPSWGRVVGTHRHVVTRTKNDVMPSRGDKIWQNEMYHVSNFQNVSIISHSIHRTSMDNHSKLWTIVKLPPQRDASAGLSDIRKMATNDQTQEKLRLQLVIYGDFVCFHVWFLWLFWSSYSLQLWPSALSQWSDVFKCLYHRLDNSKILGKVLTFFQELLENSDCDMDLTHPRFPRKLLTSVLTSDIVDMCWHAGTVKKNGSLSKNIFRCSFVTFLKPLFIIAPGFGE